jgi:thiol-disulfide isomerase/thioredoxin
MTANPLLPGRLLVLSLALAFSGTLGSVAIGQARQAKNQTEQSRSSEQERPPSSERRQNEIGGRSTAEARTIAVEGVSPAALMQNVYDGLAWISSARSFRIRTEYKVTHTEAARRWEAKHPQRGPFGGGGELDARPYCLNSEWAWDAARIHRRIHSGYEGEPAFSQETRIWDGKLAVSQSESADKSRSQYVLGDKAGQFFERSVTPMELPWMLYGVHNLWWLPLDAADYRDKSGLAPRDFERVGQEDVNGRPCHVIESRVGHYRFHIGVADGRLYRRTALYLHVKSPGYDQLALLREVGGPSIRTTFHWQPWLESLEPAERRRAQRAHSIAEFKFAPPGFYQTFDDYREVAPEYWLPFRVTIDRFNWELPDPSIASHSEQIVTSASVNQPLPDELFHIELTDGVPVTTDWRYDPIIRYTYRKDQTEEERLALQAAERKKRDEAAQEMERRQTVIKSRLRHAPLPLPDSGWLTGKALSWEELRGRVVVLHFWAVNCAPCQNELPFLAEWHRNSAKSGIVVIGVHPPTDDVSAVRKKLEEFGADYPVLIDAPAEKPDGLGQLHDWFGTSWWPHTVLISRRGVIAGHGQLWLGDIPAQMRQLAAKAD